METSSTSTKSSDKLFDSDKVDHRRFGEHAGNRRELKSIFDPLAETISGRITSAITERPIDVKEKLRQIPQYKIPYDIPYASLPPNLFEGREPVLPSVEKVDLLHLTDDEILDMDDNDQHPWRYKLKEIVSEYSWRLEMNGTEYEKSISEKLISDLEFIGMYENGYRDLLNRFNPHTWHEYETAYKNMRDNGQEHNLYELNKMRARNGKNRYGAPAKYETFIMTHSDAETDSMFNNIVMPVGAYGEEFSKNLSQSTLFIMESIDHAADDEVEAVTEAHRKILQAHTMRGFEEKEGPNSRSTKLTLQEGALSIMQTVAMLTADKVDGYDDPQKLLHDLVSQGLIEKVTRMVPLGLVAPIALDGDYFPHPIKVSENGELELSDEFTKWLNDSRAKYWQELSKNNGASASSGYGLTCPASGKRGGVRMFSDTLVSVYDAVAA